MDHYILTIYREDDTTPWIEVGTDPAHPRPYLHLPGGASRGDIDLRQGKALVGEMQIRVIDPQTGTDQSERWITERLGIPQGEEGAGHSAINGRRAVLRRASGRLVMDGVVTGVTLSESFAGFSFSLRDIRERHRRISLFTRTGTASVLPRGVVNGYGQLPGGGWLIEPTKPLRATFHVQSAILGGSGYFSLARYWRGTPIHDHNATVPPELVFTPAMEHALQAREPLGWPALGRYQHVEVWWRATSGDTSWRKIAHPGGGSSWPHTALLNTAPARLRDAGERNGAEVQGIYSIGVTRGLFDDPLPSDGQEVDVMVVYIGPPSEQYPFHWEGTAGEFLRNLYRGDWSDRPITTHVDEAALLALDTPIRIRLTEAPSADDSREWIESIYRALRAAPALDLQGRISPVTAAIPPAGETLPELTDENCQPIPGWSHPTSDAVTAVAVTYERDYRVPVEADPLGERSAGDGLASVEVRVEHRAPDWVIDLMGEHVHEIDGWMFRALGGIDGEPATGDITDETGARVAERAAREILDRYVFGGQVSFARVRAADFPTLRAGSWLIDKRSWRPNYRTGQRGGETLVQVMSVHEVDPAWLEIRMVDAGPADQPLSQPTLGTPTVTADGAVQIPVTSVPAGGEAAIYYAVGAQAPALGSGAWQLAGRIDEPGVVLTPPQPDGATVWITARGEGLGRRPSGYTTPVAVQIPVTARVREVRITFDAAGVPTVHWVPGAHTQGIRVRWIVHDIDDPSPSPGSPIDVAASAGSLQLPATVRAHEAITADVEPWTGWTGSAVSGTAGPAVRTAESPLAPTGVLYTECKARVVDSDATTVTIQVDATPAHAEVHLLGTVKAARLSGPEPLRSAPSGTQWVFERPAFQAGEGQAVFRATAPGYESDDDHIVIPEQGRDTVGLVMRASVQQVTATQITVRVAVADPQPGAGNVTITYSATGGAGLTVSPASPQMIPAASVTSDLATTGYVDFTITRPESGSGGGRVTFTASRIGRVPDVDAVDVPELPPNVPAQLPPRALIRILEYTDLFDAVVQITGTAGGMGAAPPTEYRWREYREGSPPGSYSSWLPLDSNRQATVTVARRPKGFVVVEAQVRTASGLESAPVTVRVAPTDGWQDDETGGPKWSFIIDDDGGQMALMNEAASKGQNLLGPDAGPMESTLTAFIERAVGLEEAGLEVGEIVSAGAEVQHQTPNVMSIEVLFLDSAGSIIASHEGNPVTSVTWERSIVQGLTIPVGTKTIIVRATNLLGGLGQARRFMLNRGPKALPFEEPPFRPNRDTADVIQPGDTKALIHVAYVDEHGRPWLLYDPDTGRDIDVGDIVNPPSISGITLAVEDDGFADHYTLGWTASANMSATWSVRAQFFREGVLRGTRTAPATDQRILFSDLGAGDGQPNMHSAIVELLNDTQQVVMTINSPVVFSTI